MLNIFSVISQEAQRERHRSTSIRVWNNLAIASYKQALGEDETMRESHMKRAREACDEVLGKKPGDAKALVTLARTWLDDPVLENLNKAEKYLKLALKSEPDRRGTKEELEGVQKKKRKAAAAQGIHMGVRPVKSPGGTFAEDEPEADRDSSAMVTGAEQDERLSAPVAVTGRVVPSMEQKLSSPIESVSEPPPEKKKKKEKRKKGLEDAVTPRGDAVVAGGLIEVSLISCTNSKPDPNPNPNPNPYPNLIACL